MAARAAAVAQQERARGLRQHDEPVGLVPVGLPCVLAPTGLALTAFGFWSAARRIPPAGHAVGRS